ncbi:MAG: Fe-S protein assembly co-chaperone HscB [Acidiferrobacterales bacterium]
MSSDLTKNYFDLFGLNVTFDLDLDDLESRFRKLQKEFHPDRFVSVSEQERRIAMQLTAHINEAYQTLIKPLSRGGYMLKLNDINVNDESDTKMDASFLMEQMELREQLDEMKNKNDQEDKIQELTLTIKSGQEKRIDELQECFKSITDDSLSHARNLIREMQFFEKMATQLEELDDEFL